jgi:hypothetical protein
MILATRKTEITLPLFTRVDRRRTGRAVEMIHTRWTCEANINLVFKTECLGFRELVGC